MNRTKAKSLMKYLPLAVLPLVLVTALGLWLNLQRRDYIPVLSVDGVWDLREMDFSGGNVYFLHGYAEIIADALLNPDEFSAREETAAALSYQQANFATGRQGVLLPDDGWYTFARISPSYSLRLYVNGEWMMDIGTPGDSRDAAVPAVGRMVFTVQPDDGAVEFVQQVSNWVHGAPGIHAGFFVGKEHSRVAAMLHEYDQSIFMGAYMGMFFIYLMLYFMLNRLKANLYFALLCLTWFVRLGVMDPSEPSPFTHIFSWITWGTLLRMEYISSLVTAVLAVAIIDALFPGVLHKYFKRCMYAVCAFFSIWFMFADTVFMSATLQFHIMRVFGAAILYIAARLIWKVRKLNQAQGVFLAGIGLFLSAVMIEFISRLIVRLPMFTGLGMINVSAFMFILCMATAVFVATRAEAEAAKNAERRMAGENAALVRINRMKADLIANVTHETTTPLAVLSLYADLIAKELRNNDISGQAADDLNTISAEAQRIAGVIDELNKHARDTDSRLSKARINLAETIEGAARLYTPIIKGTGSALGLDICDSLPDVYACPGEITQVLMNLLQNARNHTENADVQIKAAANPNHDFAEITVTDTGRGIAEGDLPKVFDKGFSHADLRGNIGSGLGLFLCKEIIQAHGGTIEIKSALGKGTAVRFTLPIWKGDRDEPGNSASD